MESATGQVQSLHGGFVTLAVDKAPVCARCAAGKGCGAALLTGPDGPAIVELRVPPGASLSVGDRVRLSVSPSWLLRAAVLAYGLPLASTVAAAALAWWSGVAVSDVRAALITGLGLAGGVLLGRYLLRRSGLCDRLEPHIEAHSRVPAA